LIPLHEIRLIGTFAQIPSSWSRALALMASGRVRTRPLVSSQRPLTEWKDAFGAFFTRQECKMLLTPAG
jgi:L-iditol 2-dehydrogenase